MLADYYNMLVIFRRAILFVIVAPNFIMPLYTPS